MINKQKTNKIDKFLQDKKINLKAKYRKQFSVYTLMHFR